MVVLSHLIYIKVEWKWKWRANIINRQQTMRYALNLKGYGFYIIHKSSDVLKSKCHKGHLKLFVVVFDTLIKLCEVTLILHFKRKKKLLSRRATDIRLSDFISCYLPLYCINRIFNSISNHGYTIDVNINIIIWYWIMLIVMEYC